MAQSFKGKGERSKAYRAKKRLPNGTQDYPSPKTRSKLVRPS